MISKEEVEKIANLSKLEFNESELSKMQLELSNILGYMEILNDIDVSGVSEKEIMSTNINYFQKDEAEKFKDTSLILKNTKTIADMVNIPAIRKEEQE